MKLQKLRKMNKAKSQFFENQINKTNTPLARLIGEKNKQQLPVPE